MKPTLLLLLLLSITSVSYAQTTKPIKKEAEKSNQKKQNHVTKKSVLKEKTFRKKGRR
jgi:hypothetical protein